LKCYFDGFSFLRRPTFVHRRQRDRLLSGRDATVGLTFFMSKCQAAAPFNGEFAQVLAAIAGEATAEH
jgi:hypothetical protein